MGAVVRRYRLLLGLTQAQVATMVGSTDEYIRRVESGSVQPGPFWVRRLARALGCTVGELEGTP